MGTKRETREREKDPLTSFEIDPRELAADAQIWDETNLGRALQSVKCIPRFPLLRTKVETRFQGMI